MKKTFTTLALGLLFMAGTAISANAQSEATLSGTNSLTSTSYLTYTPTQSGTLTAEFSGTGIFTMDGTSADSFLYKTISGSGTTDQPYQGSQDVPMTIDSYSNMYASKVSWVVDASTQYYFVYNGTLTFTLSFEAGAGSGDDSNNVITAGDKFTAYNKLMTYQPVKDGLLTITAYSSYQFDWCSPAGSGLLFNDASHDQKITLSCEDVDANPLVFTVPVKANTTYYFYNDAANCEFLFELGDLPIPALVSTAPAPGQAIDAEGDYGSGVLLTFNPQNVTFTSATVTYTPLTSSEETTVELQPEGGEDNVGENADYAYNSNGTWKFRAVSKYYDLAAKGTKVTLTLTGANYDGIAVQNNETGSPAASVSNGTVTIYWAKPEIEMALENQYWPTKVYATSTQGDPSMIGTLTFNMPISTEAGQLPSASMVFGNQTYGAGSSGDNFDPGMDLPCVADGNTISVDLSGIDFAALKETQPNKSYTSITVFVANIFGADGQKFIQENPGFKALINYDATTEAPAPETFSGATLTYEDDIMYPSVFVAWNQQISAIVAGDKLTGTLVTPTEEEVEVELVLTTYLPDANEGETYDAYNAVVLSMNEYLTQYGGGEYTLSIGSIVKNANNAINEPFNGSFDATAVPTISTVEPTVVMTLENITINWNNLAVSEYNPYDAEIRIIQDGETASEDDEVEFSLSVGNGVTIDGANVVIDIESLDLTEMTSYTLYVPDYYFFLGNDNTVNNEVVYQFTYDTTGVSSLASDKLGDVNVYNLQGMKVNANNLKPGIYVINGKKVLVK